MKLNQNTANKKDRLSEVTTIQSKSLPQKQKDIFQHLRPTRLQRLFGIDQAQKNLMAAILAPGQPWITVIEGISGLGKTTLADHLVRALLGHPAFDHIAWVNANPLLVDLCSLKGESISAQTAPVQSSIEAIIDALLPQLAPDISPAIPSAEKFYLIKQIFAQGNYLVVIDNIESVTGDPELIPLLQSWANPSKIVLTSRYSFKSVADLFCLTLSELTPDEAFDLLRHEGAMRGIVSLAKASNKQLWEIYEVVGGNPLALKLIVGQIYALPLAKVLQNIQEAHGQAVKDLYMRVYWQSWQHLSDSERQTLLMMPLAGPNGVTFEHLAAMSDLAEESLSQAIQKLAHCSLIEVGGDTVTPRYRIHRLTEAFLLKEITHWQTVQKQSSSIISQ